MILLSAVLLAITFIAIAGVSGILTPGMAVLVAAGPALIWLVRRPAYLLGAAYAANGWGTYNLGMALTPMKVTTSLLIAVTCLQMLTRRRIEPMPTKFFASMGLMFALVASSELNAVFGADASSLFEFGGTIVFVLLLGQQLHDNSVLRVFAIVATFNMLAFGAFVVNEVSWSAMMAGTVRAHGPCNQPNHLASIAALSLPFAIAVAVDRANNRLWLRGAGVLGVAAAVYVQYAAASRGGTLALLVAMATMAWLVTERLGTRVAGLLLVGALAVGFGSLAPNSFKNRVIETSSSAEKLNENQSERFDHAGFALRMIPERPWIGYGRLGFSEARAYETQGRRTALHSSIMSMAVAYGLPATLLFIGVVLASMWIGMKAVQRWQNNAVYGHGLIASVASVFMSSMSGTDLFRVSLWGPVAMLYVLATRPESRPRVRAMARQAPDRPPLLEGRALAPPYPASIR